MWRLAERWSWALAGTQADPTRCSNLTVGCSCWRYLKLLTQQQKQTNWNKIGETLNREVLRTVLLSIAGWTGVTTSKERWKEDVLFSSWFHTNTFVAGRISCVQISASRAKLPPVSGNRSEEIFRNKEMTAITPCHGIDNYYTTVNIYQEIPSRSVLFPPVLPRGRHGAAICWENWHDQVRIFVSFLWFWKHWFKEYYG